MGYFSTLLVKDWLRVPKVCWGKGEIPLLWNFANLKKFPLLKVSMQVV